MNISDDIICGICNQPKQLQLDHICIPVVEIKQEVIEEEIESGNPPNNALASASQAYQCQQSEIKVYPKMEQLEGESERGLINTNGLNSFCSPQNLTQQTGNYGAMEMGPYFCQRCGEIFLSIDNLKKHMEILKINCHLCGRMFCSINAIEEHLAAQHSEENYLQNMTITGPKCTLCKDVFFSDNDLKLHMNIEKVRCSICNKLWCSFVALKTHLGVCNLTKLGEIPKEQPIKNKQPIGSRVLIVPSINIGNIVATTPKNGLNDNNSRNCFPITLTKVNSPSVFEVRDEQTRPQFRQEVFDEAIVPDSIHADNAETAVEICDNISSPAENPLIKQEVISDEEQENYTCPFCQKNFPSLLELEKHKVVHTNDTSVLYIFDGYIWKKSLGLKSTLSEKNLETHSWGRPLQGNKCEKTLTTNQPLNSHSEKKPFECPDCKKFFKTEDTLGEHLKFHSGKEALVCPECKKCCKTRKSLGEHWKTHSTERAFECPDCQKSFKAKKGLQQHLKIHSSEKPFECSKCNKSFRTQNHLRRHFKVHLRENSAKCPL